FVDPQPAEWFPEALHAADVLLVTQRATVTDMSLPSKLTSYFRAGRPVVAAVADTSATANAVRRSGGGLVVHPEEPAALVDAIRQLTEDDALSARLAAAGRAFASQHMDAEACLARAASFVAGLLREREAAGPETAATEEVA
ncbi:MAG TPA: glycosyltransferase, partial [Solirubrobacterales bacterium]|nr:glycosyltransferase [Solirubrobacterales bacterium]